MASFLTQSTHGAAAHERAKVDAVDLKIILLEERILEVSWSVSQLEYSPSSYIRKNSSNPGIPTPYRYNSGNNVIRPGKLIVQQPEK
jgi:hypothetical protein